MTATSSSHDSAPVLDHDGDTFSLPSIPTLASVLAGAPESASPPPPAPVVHERIAPAPAPELAPTIDAPAPMIDPVPASTMKPRLAPAIEPEQTLPPPDVDSVTSPDAADDEPDAESKPGSVRRWLSGFNAED